MTITGITLLTLDQYREAKPYINTIKCWWWLRTPGNNNGYVLCVDPLGRVAQEQLIVGDEEPGVPADTEYIGVRPAILLMEEETRRLRFGEQIYQRDFTWTYIPGNMALCNDIFYTSAFSNSIGDEHASDYDHSDIKMSLDRWMYYEQIEKSGDELPASIPENEFVAYAQQFRFAEKLMRVGLYDDPAYIEVYNAFAQADMEGFTDDVKNRILSVSRALQFANVHTGH